VTNKNVVSQNTAHISGEDAVIGYLGVDTIQVVFIMDYLAGKR